MQLCRGDGGDDRGLAIAAFAAVDAQLLAQAGAAAVSQNGQFAIECFAVVQLQPVAALLRPQGGYFGGAVPVDQVAVQCIPQAVAEPGVFYYLAEGADLLFTGMQFGGGKAALFGDVDVFDGLRPLRHLRPDAQPLIDLLAAMGQRRGAGVIAGLECVAGSEGLDQGDAPAAFAGTLLQGQCQAGTDQTAADDGYVDGFHGILLLPCKGWCLHVWCRRQRST